MRKAEEQRDGRDGGETGWNSPDPVQYSIRGICEEFDRNRENTSPVQIIWSPDSSKVEDQVGTAVGNLEPQKMMSIALRVAAIPCP